MSIPPNAKKSRLTPLPIPEITLCVLGATCFSLNSRAIALPPASAAGMQELGVALKANAQATQTTISKQSASGSGTDPNPALTANQSALPLPPLAPANTPKMPQNALAQTVEAIEEKSPLNVPNRAMTGPLDSGNDGTENLATDPMAQVTSVSELSDVDPTHWAFQALQSLVERYGCIEGYPDRTYRGNRATTRYEFAAGLNACLNRIQELIGAAVADLPSREDLATIRRLQEEFAAELASLRGRVDVLEARTTELEANQFSTTTKLVGIVMMGVNDLLSGDGDDEVVFQERIRLNLNTSFTGKDLLVTQLGTGNATARNLVGGTREGILNYQRFGDFGNDVFLTWLEYIFPVGDQLRVHVSGANGLLWFGADRLNPYMDDFDNGSLGPSAFSQANAIYRLGGGSGIGFAYKFNNNFSLNAGYLAGEPGNPDDNKGIFNGTYASLAQLTWRPTNQLAFAAVYNHGYFRKGTFNFGDNAGSFGLGGWVGSGIANNVPAQFPIAANSYGGQFSWQASRHFVLSGWVGFTKIRAIGVGDGDIWNYAVTMAFPDVGKKGNLGGIVVGAEPYLSRLENVRIPSNDTSLHVEGFYKYQITDNIAVTPGLIWITAPNQDADNEDIVIGHIRTTFTF